MRTWLLWAVVGCIVPAVLAGCRNAPSPSSRQERAGKDEPQARTVETAPDQEQEAETPPPPDEEPSRWRIDTVCVDAGHGGRDSGTEIGDAGEATEKAVTLDIALRVRTALVAEGLTVVMTREDDRFVDRHARARISNAAGAGLFLSIHCNAYEDETVSGLEVYYLGDGSLPEAGRFAELVRATLVDALGVRDRGLREADFTVLSQTNCPAVLVEVGYLTNTTERARLMDEAYRQAIAEALAGAIVKFAERGEAAEAEAPPSTEVP